VHRSERNTPVVVEVSVILVLQIVIMKEVIIINGCVYAGTDSETALRDAFIMFDEEKKGKLAEE